MGIFFKYIYGGEDFIIYISYFSHLEFGVLLQPFVAGLPCHIRLNS
jgi:hypothetical protein